MKTKQSFVTNSSSTSFILIGEKIKREEIDFTSKNEYMVYNGESIYNIYKEDLDDHNPEGNYDFFRVFFYTSGETMENMNELSIEDLNIPEGCKVKVIYGNSLC